VGFVLDKVANTTSVPLPGSHSTDCATIWGWYDGPSSGRRTKWTQDWNSVYLPPGFGTGTPTLLGHLQRARFSFFGFLGWGETESSWYVGH
jgi:hypothetical protein